MDKPLEEILKDIEKDFQSVANSIGLIASITGDHERRLEQLEQDVEILAKSVKPPFSAI